MIPALTGPAIRHRPEQVQQVITDIGDRGRHGTRSRLVISKTMADWTTAKLQG